MTAPNPQQRLQSLSEEYQNLQTDLQTQITSRQRLESQQQENLAVRKEFNILSDDSTIYKLIGPVLLKQEKTEAESAVDGRLDFIEKEIKRVEQLISDMQEQSEGKKMEVYQLQMKMQEAK
ncbi:Prefoldin subunit 6 [Xanthoria parietina]